MPPTVDYGRLAASIQRSRLILRWARQARVEIAREAAGSRFAEGGAIRPVKLNLLALYQTIVGDLLISKEPRYLLTTADHDASPHVRVEQDWLNEQSLLLDLATVGRRVVTDALYSTGICKVSLATPCDAAVQAWGITAGQPTARAVDLDDFVYDVSAKEFGEATYVGHRYRCPVDVAKKMYGQKARNLQGEDLPTFNEHGDERIGRLLHGTHSVEEFEDHVELWELYLPRHKLVVTLAGKNVDESTENGKGYAEPLWVQKWVGPEWGPYLFLKLGTVPGSAMAKAPMMDLMELHLDANNVHRKANNTLRRMKELTLYPRQNDADAKAIKDANDGDMVPVQDPERVKPYISGGAAIQGLMTAGAMYKDLFSFMGGNLELLGGRGAQSRTATQDKILNQNAGGGIEAMHGEVESFMSRLGESLLWYAHHHPQLVMESEYKKPGMKGVTRRLYPAESQGSPKRDFPFHRARLRVDPYSLRRKASEERLAFINQVIQQFTPMLPLLQAQGISLDANYLVQLFSDLGDEPRLTELFTTSETQGESPAGGHERTLPAQTERSYNRTNTPQPQGAGQAVAEMSPQDFGAQPQAAGAV